MRMFLYMVDICSKILCTKCQFGDICRLSFRPVFVIDFFYTDIPYCSRNLLFAYVHVIHQLLGAQAPLHGAFVLGHFL